MAVWENGSEQQLEQGKDAFCHPPFQHFLVWIMSDAIEVHDRKVSIGGRNTTNLRNLRNADDIDVLAEEEQEQETLVESLDKSCTR